MVCRASQLKRAGRSEKSSELRATHLSWYQLTIEPNTEFYARPPPLPEDDLLAEMQDSGIELISEAGFRRYEVSAYSQPGYSLSIISTIGCLATIWESVQAPMVSSAIRIRVSSNGLAKRQPAHYLASELSRLAEVDPVSPEERTLEFLLNSLRLVEGFASTSTKPEQGSVSAT